jgi:hypothetical protein
MQRSINRRIATHTSLKIKRNLAEKQKQKGLVAWVKW